MISLLSTILGLSYEHKIHLSKCTIKIVVFALICTIIMISFIVIIGLGNPAVAVLDLSVAIIIIVLTLMRIADSP